MNCKSVLIIEDDEDLRQSMRDVLEIQGYQAYCVSDGKEAIDRLNALEVLPCVILLDMMMPGMNGWQFLDYQRNTSKYSSIPVIVCSALSATAKTLKPAAIVPKPVELKKLLQTVQSFCA